LSKRDQIAGPEITTRINIAAVFQILK